MTKIIEWTTNKKGCMLVTSHRQDEQGYIIVTRNNKKWRLHRWVYTQKHGEIPEGKLILHSCDEPSCININHLSVGTHQDNMNDMMNKGRHFTKAITPNNIKELRLKRNISMRKLSSMSGVDFSYLSKIENHTKSCSLITLQSIANALQVHISELLKEE
jgi:DNA-binding Xre family transcriptional regulator